MNRVNQSTFSRDILFRSASIEDTFTLTVSPTDMRSAGFFTNFLLSFEMCIRPSWWTPMSTKAPKFTTLVTVPSRIISSFRSLISFMSGEYSMLLNVFLGSRPGFFNSSSMSCSVWMPYSSVV